MSNRVATITLSMPLGMGKVNCHLLEGQHGYVLVDTGVPSARETLIEELSGLGCRPGSLTLIVLTHGDFDHTGNAAHIRSVFGSKIAMHSGDARMAETGDMFANRQKSNSLLRALIPWLIGFGSSERFTPDTLLEDGASLHDYGLEAEVIWTPGHSRGSIGILTGDGRFFCGDLLVSTKRPAVNSLIDDPEAIRRSIEKLRTLKIETVYPGHGKPFSMDQLSDASR